MIDPPPDDAGYSLIDVVVSMTIMVIVLGLFTSGVVLMFGSSEKADSVSQAQTQVNQAFLRLDTMIRYASGISEPGKIGDDHYVEFLTTNSGSSICTELRLNAAAKQLQYRTWPQGAIPFAPSAWTPLANDLSGTLPFDYREPSSDQQFQRLTLAVTSAVGTNKDASAKQTEVTFTALNTSLTTTTPTTCTEGRAKT